MISERRHFIRVDTGLKFSYRLRNKKKPRLSATTSNISPSGIRSNVDKQIQKGDWLVLSINIPSLKKPIPAIGKVVWTADAKGKKVSAGIKFEEINAEMKNKFLEHICNLMFSELEKSRSR
ncbi:MAG: PilZ domain-containing protein [Candidatus Omnitrophota bacterium]|nr:PilZ domain-containing protein [Candidatus Omnitrophota bacterium]|tara:strand:- start:619 stop:981 length:363 start_codon:yes stop_codon:yes gene_type:complete